MNDSCYSRSEHGRFVGITAGCLLFSSLPRARFPFGTIQSRLRSHSAYVCLLFMWRPSFLSYRIIRLLCLTRNQICLMGILVCLPCLLSCTYLPQVKRSGIKKKKNRVGKNQSVNGQISHIRWTPTGLCGREDMKTGQTSTISTTTTSIAKGFCYNVDFDWSASFGRKPDRMCARLIITPQWRTAESQSHSTHPSSIITRKLRSCWRK